MQVTKLVPYGKYKVRYPLRAAVVPQRAVERTPHNREVMGSNHASARLFFYSLSSASLMQASKEVHTTDFPI